MSEFSYFTKRPDRLEIASHSPGSMAQYKYSHYLSNFSDPKFDPAHPPGTATPHTGIYKCQGCGDEVVSTAGDPLPPPSHHQHSLAQGGIAWRLIVATG
jgi:hypothetical protein